MKFRPTALRWPLNAYPAMSVLQPFWVGVPEPSGIALLLTGCLVIDRIRRRRLA